MGRPKNADKVRNRDTIVDQATILFAARGFDGVSIRDIADAASIHVSTLYHYYPQKSQLYDEIVARAVDYVKELFISAFGQSDDPRVAVAHFFEKVLRLWGSEQPYTKIIDRVLMTDTALEHLFDRAVSEQVRGEIRAFAATLSGRPMNEAGLADFAEILFAMPYGVAKLRRLNQVMLRDGAPPHDPTAIAGLMSSWLTDGLSRTVAREASRSDLDAPPRPIPRARKQKLTRPA